MYIGSGGTNVENLTVEKCKMAARRPLEFSATAQNLVTSESAGERGGVWR
jgi:hypothetical protein